jgi:hypothetical protein
LKLPESRLIADLLLRQVDAEGWRDAIVTTNVLRARNPATARRLTTEAYTAMQMSKIVRKVRDRLGLPVTFTLDACRHGGMTELEAAELTDGQGRALSGHRTQRAYEGYAKRTLERALPATRRRYAHALANVQSTAIQNAACSSVQNDSTADDTAIA